MCAGRKERDREPASASQRSLTQEAKAAAHIDCTTNNRRMGEEKEHKKVDKKKRKSKDYFIYGNYESYYGYRIGQKHTEDPRLAAFKKEWFEGKDCLDIGCNQGLITISVARKFCCRSIVGVDIDASLIEKANRNLRKVARLEHVNNQSMGSSERVNCLEQQVHESLSEERTNSANELVSSQKISFFDRVSFQKENFVDSLKQCSEKYDTILCLSVTKWIHFNWGDDGLITLFVKIWRLLRPGGILILEPQPWQSYTRKRMVSEIAKVNYSNIFFKPEHFQEILLDKIGFRTVENFTENIPGSVTGFDRPIFVFRK